MTKKILLKNIMIILAICAGLMFVLPAVALAEDTIPAGGAPLPVADTPDAPDALAVEEEAATAQEEALAEEPEVIADPAADFRAEILRLVNEARDAAGLTALTLTDQLIEMADIRAEEAAAHFSHTRPDGSKCFSIYGEYGLSYRFAGENLAYGYDTAEEAFNAWMDSPTHEANILSARYTQIGIGYFVKNNGKIYCSELFCTPKFTFKGLGVN